MKRRTFLKRSSIGLSALVAGAAGPRGAPRPGPPDVRAAIERDDPRAFVQALETRGLIQSPEPSQLAQRIGAQLESLKSELGDRFTPEACSVFAICIAAVWIWVAVVQDAVVAVAVAAAVSVYAYVLVSTSVAGGGGGGGGGRQRKRVFKLLEDHPSLRLAGALGGHEFREPLAATFVEENVERIASAVETLEIYRKAGVIPADRLRHLVRGQMLRQLKGHAADFGASLA